MSNNHLARADGYAGLGMFERAWNALEELPASARTNSPVLELRLRILTALERWQLGASIARFHHAYARHLSLAGDWQRSREQIRAAVAAWPEIRLALVDDLELEALWEG